MKILLCLLMTLTILIGTCQESFGQQQPVPSRPLTLEQKLTDFKVLVSQIKESYTFVDYKEGRFNFNIDSLEQEYISLIMKSKTNSEFYGLLHKFVANFADAHFSLNFRPSSLGGASEIAILGIMGIKHGDNVLISELHPLIQHSENFPIQPGDIVTKIDGKSIKDYINTELVPYRNLGREESNLSHHTKNLFQRFSLSTAIPNKKYVKITYLSREAGKELTVELPWILRDFSDFIFETEQLRENPFVLNVTDKKTGTKFPMVYYQANSRPINLLEKFNLTNKSGEMTNKLISFELDSAAGWTSAHAEKYLSFIEATGKEALALERIIPADVIFIDEAKTYPAYIESVKMGNGKIKNVGYIRIGTFSTKTKEHEVINELRATLRKFEKHGVKDIVLDLLDNPGGSLSLVVNVAQTFSNKKIKTFDMKFGLSENWLNDFTLLSSQLGRGSESAIAEDVLNELMVDYENGLKTSSKAYPIESFMPFDVAVNYELQTKFNMVALINEGNASSGDIIAYLLKRNNMAILMGQNTMGAGGNVVKHLQAPHSHFEARLTESAIIMEGGEYLENNGVKPHFVIDLQKMKYNGYKDFINKAFLLVSDGKTYAVLKKNAKAAMKGEVVKCDVFLLK